MHEHEAAVARDADHGGGVLLRIGPRQRGAVAAEQARRLKHRAVAVAERGEIEVGAAAAGDQRGRVGRRVRIDAR